MKGEAHSVYVAQDSIETLMDSIYQVFRREEADKKIPEYVRVCCLDSLAEICHFKIQAPADKKP